MSLICDYESIGYTIFCTDCVSFEPLYDLFSSCEDLCSDHVDCLGFFMNDAEKAHCLVVVKEQPSGFVNKDFGVRGSYLRKLPNPCRLPGESLTHQSTRHLLHESSMHQITRHLEECDATCGLVIIAAIPGFLLAAFLAFCVLSCVITLLYHLCKVLYLNIIAAVKDCLEWCNKRQPDYDSSLDETQASATEPLETETPSETQQGGSARGTAGSVSEDENGTATDTHTESSHHTGDAAIVAGTCAVDDDQTALSREHVSQTCKYFL